MTKARSTMPPPPPVATAPASPEPKIKLPAGVAVLSCRVIATESAPTHRDFSRKIEVNLKTRDAEIVERVRLAAQAIADQNPIPGYRRQITTADALRMILEQVAESIEPPPVLKS